MESTKKRNIKNGAAYDHLFPAANVDTHTIMRHAGVSDTVSFIPQVVAKTLDHTAKIAQKLKGYNDYDTCRNIWHFVYGHIAYQKDKDGYEQIRSPARTWHDRKAGVDCDCYATFISSILTNLKIPHLLRITKYHRDYFQHIYPVAILRGKTAVVIDCVTDQFNYEVPYSEKKDFNMDLQYLDGIETDGFGNLDYPGHDWQDDLGRAHKKKKKNTHESFEDFMDHGDSVPDYGVKKKKGFKKLLNFVNKLNPATVTLRNGVLAAMKLNVGQMSKRLRWSYLTPNQARKKGIDIDKWKHLVSVRQKLDNIYFGAGGKPENLKKAIMNGKGNKDKAMHGLGFPYSYHDHEASANNVQPMSVHTPLPQLLGHDVFYSENEGVQGLGELGEPFTLTAIAAASGVIASVVKMLKKVGDIFKGQGPHSADFNSKETEDAEKDIPADKSPKKSGKDANSDDEDISTPSKSAKKSSGASSDDNNGEESETNNAKDKTSRSLTKSGSTDLTTDDGQADPAKPPGTPDGETFWSKNKKWLLPTSIGVGGLAIIAAGIHVLNTHNTHKPVHGVPNNKAKHKTTGHQKKKNHHRKTKSNAKQVSKVKW